MQRQYGPLEDRLLARLRMTDECWEWLGTRTDQGYGRMRYHGTTWLVHRLMMEWKLGKPLGRHDVVDHLCRNRACARPSHLEIVTATVNTQRGNRAKITDAHVRDIRRKRHHGVLLKVLAQAYGVHYTHLSRLCRGVVWKNVPLHQRHAAETRRRYKELVGGQLTFLAED